MIALLCLTLPPVFLMYMRDKILGDKLSCAFHKGLSDFLREYVLAALFLNFISIAVTCLVAPQDQGLAVAFAQNAVFPFGYLLLSILIALVTPVLENFFRFHFHIHTLDQSVNPIRINLKTLFYVYTGVLFLLNFVRIFDNAFWGDEGFTIRLVQMGLVEMINETANDVHPPLHYLFTQLLYHIFGNHGFTYHLTGLIPYGVILVIASTYIRKRFGYIPAVILVTMSSLMKNAVIYNVEARMYTMASMFVLASFLAFYEILTRNNRASWVVFVSASLCAAYTHYYALISVAVFYVMLLPIAWKSKVYRKPTAIAYGVTIVAYLPWLFVLVASFKRTAADWWVENIPTVEECVLFLLDYKWLYQIFAAILVIITVYHFKAVRVHVANREKCRLFDKLNVTVQVPENVGFSPDFILIITGLLSIFGTIFAGLLLSYAVRPFFVERYTYVFSAVAYFLLGLCISKLTFKKTWCALLVCSLLWVSVPSYVSTFLNDKYLDQSNTMFLNAVKPSSEAVLYTDNDHLGWNLLCYYYPDNFSQYNPNFIEQLVEKPEKEVWLFWSDVASNELLTSIQHLGYSCEEVYEGWFANNIDYHVYRLLKVT